MAAPDKNLRVSPSGPLATPLDTFPLEEMAGLVFQTVYTGSGNEFRNAIGPSDAAAALQGLQMYRGDGPALAGSSFNAQSLDPQFDATPFGLEAGIWRVEAHLCLGFDTRPPTAATFADLLATFHAVNADGSSAVSGAPPSSPVAKGITLGAASPPAPSTPGAAKSVVLETMLEVTEAMVGANGGPLPGLSCVLTRVNSPTTQVGDWDTTSGYLEFTTDCRLFVRRFR